MKIIKTEEGCTSDVIVKPLNVENDEWLRIQVKTTLDICHDLYTFNLGNNKYIDHVILCHCINKNKYWLIPYIEVMHIKNKLNIGQTSCSKYFKYEVNEDSLINTFNDYYQKMKLFTCKECMIPPNILQQKELIFKQRREEAFTFLKFERPRYNQSFYDFVVNGVRVQEKVATLRKDRKNTYVIFLYRSLSNNGRNMKYQPYKQGMNSYYWIHIPETNIFYVIPDAELCQRGYIETCTKLNTTRPVLSIRPSDQVMWYQ